MYVMQKCLGQLQRRVQWLHLLKYASHRYSSVYFFTMCSLLELNGVGTCVWIFDSFEIVNAHPEAPQHRIPQIFQLRNHFFLHLFPFLSCQGLKPEQWPRGLLIWRIQFNNLFHISNSFIIVLQLFVCFCSPEQGFHVWWIELKCFCAFFNRLIMFPQLQEAYSTIWMARRTYILGRFQLSSNLQSNFILR